MPDGGGAPVQLVGAGPSSARDSRASSPDVTRAQAGLAHMASLMVGLLDPLHLVGLEGRLGEVQ